MILTHMESRSNQKVLNKSKYILYLRFFKVATHCLDDSFAQAWHSLRKPANNAAPILIKEYRGFWLHYITLTLLLCFILHCNYCKY